MHELWNHLTAPPPADRVFTIGWMAYFVLFAAGFVMTVHLSGPAARNIAAHAARRRMIQRLAAIAAWIFGFGLFFFGNRALQIDPLSFGSPIWLWCSLIALAAFVLYTVQQLRRDLPNPIVSSEHERVSPRQPYDIGHNAKSR